MSGSKQHFIPQSLLKGFGFQKGKNTHVVVYTYDRGVFSTATPGIGAERYFYSELPVEHEVETLDHLITKYETHVAEVLAKLRGLDDGEAAETEAASELVTHLIIRNDHFRKSMLSASVSVIDGLASALTEEELAKAALGLVGDKPSALFTETLSKEFAPYQPLVAMHGISEQQLSDLMFAFVKANFDTLHSNLLRPYFEAFFGMIGSVSDVTANAQRRSLDRSLAPEPRVERMKDYSWRVVHSKVPLVLPDCISIAFDGEGEVYPLILADLDAAELVFMPLSATRLLIGSRGEKAEVPDRINEVFAACSWDFFVTNERTAKLEQLRATLRTRVEQFLNEAVNDAVADALRLHSGTA